MGPSQQVVAEIALGVMLLAMERQIATGQKHLQLFFRDVWRARHREGTENLPVTTQDFLDWLLRAGPMAAARQRGPWPRRRTRTPYAAWRGIPGLTAGLPPPAASATSRSTGRKEEGGP